jgi:hypothetical protein
VPVSFPLTVVFIIGEYLSAQRPWQSLAGQRAGGHNKEFRA